MSQFNKATKALGGLHSYCRSCQSEKSREYARGYKRPIPEPAREKLCVRCSQVKVVSEFYKSRDKKSGLTAHCKACMLTRQAEFYRSNKVRLKQERLRFSEKNKARYKERRSEDQSFRIKCNLRTRLSMAVRNDVKSGSAVQDLGCSIEDFKSFLQSQFQPGMSWNNYGKGMGFWNIDHIMPLSAFDLTNRQHVLLACHYGNLQPLWFEDNVYKSGKLPNAA